MMNYPLQITKMIQAAGVILAHHKRRPLGRWRLLKLMYIADREVLRQTGRPICGGNQVAMNHGPLHSEMYDAIKGGDPKFADWSRFMRTEGISVVLVADPGTGKLTRLDEQVLRQVVDKYGYMPDRALRKLVHEFKEFAEHEPRGGSSRRIPWESIIEAVGLGPWLKSIEAEERARSAPLPTK